jgi:transposase
MAGNETAQREIVALRRELAEEKQRRKEEAQKAAEENNTLRREIRELRHTVTELAAAVADLTARLGQNSSNSSVPPSQDPPSTPKPKSLRHKTGRHPGGQQGHKGTTLELADHPDQVHVHQPSQCARCGASLAEAPTTQVSRHQVVDIPPIVPTVTEHQIVSKKCPCGHVTTPATPPGAEARTQYGPSALALMVYLYNAQHLSITRCAQLFRDMLRTPLSAATILKASRQAAKRIDQDFAPAAKQALAGGTILHVDETSVKQDGHKAWLHSASNPHWTWITAHRKRGREGSDAAGILPAFHGVLIHDCWAPYDTYPNVSAHQLCIAHVLRELQAVTDWHATNHPHEQWCWASQAQQGLRLVIHDPSQAGQARSQILAAVNVALSETGETGWAAGQIGKKHRALARRLKDRITDYLYFASHPGIPPTNNPAEQEIRCAKIRTKISGTMRTMAGAETFASIRSYLSTARKHSQHPLTVLTSLTGPNIWQPTTP